MTSLSGNTGCPLTRMTSLGMSDNGALKVRQEAGMNMRGRSHMNDKHEYMNRDGMNWIEDACT